MNDTRKPHTVFEVPQKSSEPSVIDVLEAMLRNPLTKRMLASPDVRVFRVIDPVTGRVTYSLRTPEDPGYSADATPLN